MCWEQSCGLAPQSPRGLPQHGLPHLSTQALRALRQSTMPLVGNYREWQPNLPCDRNGHESTRRSPDDRFCGSTDKEKPHPPLHRAAVCVSCVLSRGNRPRRRAWFRVWEDDQETITLAYIDRGDLEHTRVCFGFPWLQTDPGKESKGASERRNHPSRPAANRNGQDDK